MADQQLPPDSPLMTMSNSFLHDGMLLLSIPGPSRDPVYYIHDGNSVLLVENTLFKVSSLLKEVVLGSRLLGCLVNGGGEDRSSRRAVTETADVGSYCLLLPPGWKSQLTRPKHDAAMRQHCGILLRRTGTDFTEMTV